MIEAIKILDLMKDVLPQDKDATLLVISVLFGVINIRSLDHLDSTSIIPAIELLLKLYLSLDLSVDYY